VPGSLSEQYSKGLAVQTQLLAKMKLYFLVSDFGSLAQSYLGGLRAGKVVGLNQ